LVQNESYPSTRNATTSDDPPKDAYVVENVAAMMQLSAAALNQAQVSYATTHREATLKNTSSTSTSSASGLLPTPGQEEAAMES
jgi:hypothetical protein